MGKIHQETTINTEKSPHKFALLLLPGFPLLSLSNVIEPLRVANLLSKENLFEWRFVSLDGKAVTSSSGVVINCDEKLVDCNWAQSIAVCAGPNIRPTDCAPYHQGIKKQSLRGCTLIGISTGSVLLGSAGLLDGYRCTAHWDFIDSFTEEFPKADVVDQIYVIDRNRVTCTGGTAAIDMMLQLISLDHDRLLSTQIAHWFLHDNTRNAEERQHKVIEARLEQQSGKMAAAIRLMRANLEEPIPLTELAKHCNSSLRQLERLFKKHQNSTIHNYYLALRLEQARKFVTQTGMPLYDIVVAVGFISLSHFGQCYKGRFGCSPMVDRKRHCTTTE